MLKSLGGADPVPLQYSTLDCSSLMRIWLDGHLSYCISQQRYMYCTATILHPCLPLRKHLGLTLSPEQRRQILHQYQPERFGPCNIVSVRLTRRMRRCDLHLLRPVQRTSLHTLDCNGNGNRCQNMRLETHDYSLSFFSSLLLLLLALLLLRVDISKDIQILSFAVVGVND